MSNCGCGCNCKCNCERYKVSDDYIVDNLNDDTLNLDDACASLNDKDRVIRELFSALSNNNCGKE